MKKIGWIIKRAFVFLMTLALVGIMNYSDANAAGGWSLEKISDGIKVYARPAPGDLMEYMAVTTIDEKMEVIGELLRDVPMFSSWQTDCYGAQVKKQYDRNTMVIYMVLNPPFIQKRDILLKNKTVYDWDNGGCVISFMTTDELNIPPEKGTVRVTLMDGEYIMEYLGRDKTKFIYRLLVDPAGDIPKKVAYSVMASYPYKTLKKMKTMLPNKKYSDAAKGTQEETAIVTRTKDEGYVRRLITNRLSKFVRDKETLKAIISADKVGINNIMKAGGSYNSAEQATTMFYFAYLDKIISDKIMIERLKNNKKVMNEITDMVVSDCGISNTTLESIVDKYKK
jgi:hypothetical protein